MLFPLYDLLPHRRFAWLVLLIIAVNVAVMGWLHQEGPQKATTVAFRYGFIPERVSEIGNGNAISVPVPHVNARGDIDPNVPPRKMELSLKPSTVYTTFLTTMFLHGGWIHLISNMWMLWVFGNNIEDRLGHFMFLGFYLLGGLVATLTHYAVDPTSDVPVVGASGAVAAVLGAYAISYPKAKVRTLVFFGMVMIMDIPALVLLGLWFVLETISGLIQLHGDLVSPVANWAHVGGFIAGIVLLPFFTLGTSPPETDWRKEADDLFQFDDPRQQQLP
jgi:membrane associated rhomboid family serine protease